MRSAVFTFFYNWGSHIQEAWKFIIFAVAVYMTVNMVFNWSSFAELFSAHTVMVNISATVMVFTCFYIIALLGVTLIMTIIRTIIRMVKTNG
jgi:hypothetical protein